MECPRLPVRRVELLDEVKREKSKRESCLAVRAFKIAQEGFQRTERRENHLLVAPATDNSLRLTGLGYWTMAKRYHTDVCCPFERQLWVFQIASKLYNGPLAPFPSLAFFSLSPLPCLCPYLSAFVDFLLLGWDTKINVRKSFPLHFSSCHFSSPSPFLSRRCPISIRFSATLVTRRRGTMEKDQLDDSGLPFARRYLRVNFVLSFFLFFFKLAKACGWYYAGNIKLYLLTFNSWLLLSFNNLINYWRKHVYSWYTRSYSIACTFTV